MCYSVLGPDYASLTRRMKTEINRVSQQKYISWQTSPKVGSDRKREAKHETPRPEPQTTPAAQTSSSCKPNFASWGLILSTQTDSSIQRCSWPSRPSSDGTVLIPQTGLWIKRQLASSTRWWMSSTWRHGWCWARCCVRTAARWWEPECRHGRVWRQDEKQIILGFPIPDEVFPG